MYQQWQGSEQQAVSYRQYDSQITTSLMQAQPPPRATDPAFPTNNVPQNQGPTRSRGRDYLLSLGSSMANLNISNPSTAPYQPYDPYRHQHSALPNMWTDKPLPRLPPPCLPPRPYSEGSRMPDGSYNSLEERRSGLSTTRYLPLPTPPQVVTRPTHSTSDPALRTNSAKEGSSKDSSSPHRTAKPAPPITPPRPAGLVQVPYSEPSVHRVVKAPSSRPRHRTPRRKQSKDPIYVPGSDSEASSSISSASTDDERFNSRLRRAVSERPVGNAASKQSSTPSKGTKSKPKPSSTPTKSVKCAGFTRKGAPCQRLVKSVTPYLSALDSNAEGDGRMAARYCRDHAGMICTPQGFYWRSGENNIWIDFEGKQQLNTTFLQLELITQTSFQATWASRLGRCFVPPWKAH